jgi:Tfp pilus assembly protein PilV
MARVRDEAGFGLIELLIAMVVLNIGILAIIAAFNSGIVALSRSGHISTASALADQQMERYRSLTYGCIYLSAAGATSNWTGDTAFNQGTMVTASQTTCATTPPAAATTAARTNVVGPDRHRYEVDTYVVTYTPANARTLLKVSVAVHDSLTGTVWSREQSTFDQSTGQ